MLNFERRTTNRTDCHCNIYCNCDLDYVVDISNTGARLVIYGKVDDSSISLVRENGHSISCNIVWKRTLPAGWCELGVAFDDDWMSVKRWVDAVNPEQNSFIDRIFDEEVRAQAVSL